MNDLRKKFENALISMNRMQAESLMRECMLEMKPLEFVESIMVPVMDLIGSGWEEQSVSLSQVYMSGRICEELADEIIPNNHSDIRKHPPMAIAVLEDHHLLGKRIVHSVLRANRFVPLDYGAVETEDLAKLVKQDQIEILLISTLMLPSALQVKELVRLIHEQGLKPKIIVGGAPFRFDKHLFREVGADATSEKASGVIGVIQQLMGEPLEEQKDDIS